MSESINSKGETAESWLRQALDSRFEFAGLPDTRRLHAGNIVSGRFRIERLAGRGGMGAVYRAHDEATSMPVAIKVLARESKERRERLGREGDRLAELSHPAVVRYVAHGDLLDGSPYLAMEWLEGEDLAQRLARARPTVTETLLLMQRACGGLAAAHARGIVHRDLKPSNLFLTGGDVAALKVIDFGISKTEAGAPLTMTDAVVGTLGYLSPEQARGRDDVDARSDLFSLGCVFFECLTGQAAFAGRHEVAVLAKVLEEDPPPVSAVSAISSPALDAIVSGLLEKDPTRRPASADALLQQLQRLGPVAEASPAPSPASRRTRGLGREEQRVVSVVMGIPGNGAASSDGEDDESAARPEATLQGLAVRFGAKINRIDGGGLLLLLSEPGLATDQAARAALCALSTRALRPTMRLSIATGRAETNGALPLGDAIDRAASLVMEEPPVDDRAGRGVALDEVTAGLLDGRFDVVVEGGRPRLHGQRRGWGGLDTPRLLMGKRSPFVGRERDLAVLRATFSECVSDDVARVVIVTASPGAGKTRLAMEFVSRTLAAETPRVLVSRPDPMSGVAPLALVAEWVRSAVGSGTPGRMTSRAPLARYLRETLAPELVERVGDFLGELVGVPAVDPGSPELAAARNDPEIMREQIRRALASWIDAELARGPLLLVLDDLHWGDAPSVAWLEDTVRRLANRALFVLVLGRPEVRERYPRLFRLEGVHELRLGGLTTRAAERLVRAVIGSELAGNLLARAVDQADGNAFYLEEFLRHVVEGSTRVPETVLAMAQSRLERLEPEARRVLRAASVFGEAFWAGGVGAILDDGADVSWWLETLTERELLVTVPSSRFAPERELRFRHALLRDAAYAMLTSHDLVVAHARAGAWLESAGESQAHVLAEHFERGGDPARAMPWLVRAAQDALDGDDLPRVQRTVDRGLALGAKGVDRGALLMAGAVVQTFRGDLPFDRLREAVGLLPPASAPFWTALAMGIYSAAGTEQQDEAGSFLMTALTTPAKAMSGSYGLCVVAILGALGALGQHRAGWVLLDQIDEVQGAPRAGEVDPMCAHWLDTARCGMGRNAAKGEARPLAYAWRRGRASFEGMVRCGSRTGEATACVLFAHAALGLGRYAEAEASARRALAIAETIGNQLNVHFANVALAWKHLDAGELSEAMRVARKSTSALDPTMACLARAVLADAHFHAGDFDAAFGQATRLRAEAAPIIPRVWSSMVRSGVLVVRGRYAEALSAIDLALEDAREVPVEFEVRLHTLRAEALDARGERAPASDAIARACDVVRAAASDIDDLELRKGYLDNVAVNVRAFSLAARLSRPA